MSVLSLLTKGRSLEVEGLNCYSIQLKSSLWGMVLEKEARNTPLEVCSSVLYLL